MKILLVLLSSASLFGTTSLEELDRLTKVPQQYQDIVVNGEVITSGVRECDKRYEKLKPLIKKYSRPITVLDLGAAEGYFSFRIAHDFDASCVMVEAGYSANWNSAQKLKELCKLNDKLSNIVLLDQRISKDVLLKLSKCEHFDVILAFNILHHIPGNKKELLSILTSMGDHVFLETPCDIARETYMALDHFPKKEFLSDFKRHTSANGIGKLYYLPGTSKGLRQKALLLPEFKYDIVSNFSEKWLIKNKKKYKWNPGINLCTFKCYNGIFPENKTLLQSLSTTNWKTHPDLTYYNVIVSGEKLSLIDDEGQPFFNPTEAYAFLRSVLNTSTVKEFSSLVNNEKLKPKRLR